MCNNYNYKNIWLSIETVTIYYHQIQYCFMIITLFEVTTRGRCLCDYDQDFHIPNQQTKKICSYFILQKLVQNKSVRWPNVYIITSFHWVMEYSLAHNTVYGILFDISQDILPLVDTYMVVMLCNNNICVNSLYCTGIIFWSDFQFNFETIHTGFNRCR